MADEYIRREDALKLLSDDIPICGASLYQAGAKGGLQIAHGIVAAIPAADVAPVVRCKDCEHARDLGFQFGSLVHESWFCIYNGPHTTGANDFCSHGQKREEGEIEDDP